MTDSAASDSTTALSPEELEAKKAQKEAKKAQKAAEKAAKEAAKQARAEEEERRKRVAGGVGFDVVQHPPVKLEPPSGTRDFFPDDYRLQSWLFDRFHAAARAAGFEQFDAPVLERQELYKRKAGEEITGQMYGFVDGDGEEVTLRPEMTPTLARMALARANSQILPLKWYSIPQCWRYEAIQRGRKREHYQWNVDIIGCRSVTAEVELLATAISFFRSVGITNKDVKIKVNSRKVMNDILTGAGVPADAFAPVCVILDKLDKIGAAAVEEQLLSVAKLPGEVAKRVLAVLACPDLEALRKLAQDAGVGDGDGMAELESVFKLGNAYGFGDWLKFDASLVRGLAYYTGVVFEAFDVRGELRAIMGGGRYDRLLSLYGAMTEVPACGFGFGDCVIVELLRERNLMPDLPRAVDIVVAPFNVDMQGAAMAVAAGLRTCKGCTVDLMLEPKKKVAQSFDYANRVGAEYIAFVAPDEWNKGLVRIKDLRIDDANLKQVDVKIDDLSRVKAILGANRRKAGGSGSKEAEAGGVAPTPAVAAAAAAGFAGSAAATLRAALSRNDGATATDLAAAQAAIDEALAGLRMISEK